MKVWVVKCNLHPSDGSDGWHWVAYFEPEDSGWSPDEVQRNWGGDEWIRSTRSHKYLREEASRGDVVVCYQKQRRQIMGLTLMAEDPTQDVSGAFNYIHLVPSAESFPLVDAEPRLDVPRLRAHGCDPKCFRHPSQGTVFAVEAEEYEGMLSTIRADHPDLRDALDEWLHGAAYKA